VVAQAKPKYLAASSKSASVALFVFLGNPLNKTAILYAGAAICATVVASSMGMRWYDDYRSRRAVEQQAQAVRDETAAQVAALAREKPDVLRKLAALQAGGDHESAIKLASRYRLTNDPQIHAAYTASVRIVSDGQALARMSELLNKGCIGLQATTAARSMIVEAKLAPGPVSTDSWRAERLDSAAHLPAIRARLMEVAVQTSSAAPDSMLARLRGDHAPRLQPSVMVAVLSQVDASKYVCVWRVTGELAVVPSQAAAPTRPFEMIIWFGPSATERTLEHDVLRVTGL